LKLLQIWSDLQSHLFAQFTPQLSLGHSKKLGYKFKILLKNIWKELSPRSQPSPSPKQMQCEELSDWQNPKVQGTLHSEIPNFLSTFLSEHFPLKLLQIWSVEHEHFKLHPIPQ
jgi:hypothetical protein